MPRFARYHSISSRSCARCHANCDEIAALGTTSISDDALREVSLDQQSMRCARYHSISTHTGRVATRERSEPDAYRGPLISDEQQ